MQSDYSSQGHNYFANIIWESILLNFIEPIAAQETTIDVDKEVKWRSAEQTVDRLNVRKR